MTPAQVETLRGRMKVRAGHEWDRFEGLSIAPDRLQAFLEGRQAVQCAQLIDEEPALEIAGAGHLMSIDEPAAYAGAIKLSLERSLQT